MQTLRNWVYLAILGCIAVAVAHALFPRDPDARLYFLIVTGALNGIILSALGIHLFPGND